MEIQLKLVAIMDAGVVKYWCKNTRPIPFLHQKWTFFERTILNTAYIKTLEILPSAREPLSIQTSESRSVGNQICLQGS